jgi:hypothetical protein
MATYPNRLLRKAFFRGLKRWAIVPLLPYGIAVSRTKIRLAKQIYDTASLDQKNRLLTHAVGHRLALVYPELGNPIKEGFKEFLLNSIDELSIIFRKGYKTEFAMQLEALKGQESELSKLIWNNRDYFNLCLELLATPEYYVSENEFFAQWFVDYIFYPGWAPSMSKGLVAAMHRIVLPKG